MKNATIDKLVQDWEAIYKRGWLTFWVLLALFHGDKRMDEIKSFIDEVSDKHFSVDDQSMYRALRRYYDVEFVDYTTQKNQHGPDWKIYSLAPTGHAVLREFAKRNIVDVMYKAKVQSLIERCVQ